MISDFIIFWVLLQTLYSAFFKYFDFILIVIIAIIVVKAAKFKNYHLHLRHLMKCFMLIYRDFHLDLKQVVNQQLFNFY